MRRRQEHQEFLASLTPEQRAAYDTERQRALELGRRQARIYAETTFNGRHIANATSDEDDLERQRQQQSGGRRRKKNNTRKTRKTKKSRRTRKTRRYKTKKIIIIHKKIYYYELFLFLLHFWQKWI
jgi:hypothetical protein